MTVRGKDLHCFVCLARFSRTVRPRMLNCRHLACVRCASVKELCEICGDLQGYGVVPQGEGVEERVVEVCECFDQLDRLELGDGRSALISILSGKLEEIEDEIRFEGVQCRAGENCHNPQCQFTHGKEAPVQLREVDRKELRESDVVGPEREGMGEEEDDTSDNRHFFDEVINLSIDSCERCKEPIKMQSVPFCVHCGYVKGIIQGKSLPNPLLRSSS